MATIAQAAAHLFLDERRFRELVDAGTISRATRGSYDLDMVREEYIRGLREIAAGRTSSGPLDPSQERARKDKEYADHLAMRNALARREQVLVGDVVQAVTNDFGIVRSRLLIIPGKLGGFLDASARSELDREIREALAELSRIGTDEDVQSFTAAGKPGR